MWASGTVIRSTARALLAYCIHWFYHSIRSGHNISLQIQPRSWRAPGSKNSANLNPHKPLSVLSVGSALPTHPRRPRLNILGVEGWTCPFEFEENLPGKCGEGELLPRKAGPRRTNLRAGSILSMSEDPRCPQLTHNTQLCPLLSPPGSRDAQSPQQPLLSAWRSKGAFGNSSLSIRPHGAPQRAPASVKTPLVKVIR